ncbi:MAG: serine hydrolase [Oscillatoriales cyanobacterium C42_A2020_001]|nr:serine hydrolase [Leptolyngbyaceae cyanobacterium C42_A2020_001]
MMPQSRRRGYSEARSQVTPLSHRSKTRFQANQPTLIQASTSLQQSTLLQGQKTLLTDGRRSKLRKQEEVSVRPQSRSLAIALYAARMVILSVGVGVLAGTVLSAWNPANNSVWGDGTNQSIKQASSVGKNAPAHPATSNQLVLTQELAPLKTAVQNVAQQYPGFTPGVFLIDLDNNSFVDWGGSGSFAAASTIKVPVLIAFFQDVDNGKVRLDEKLTMRKDLIATESGDMQYLPPGAQFTALETATKMITISDNTATNMLIDRLGGIQAVNQRFKSWGLSATQITNLLPDLKGTNTTSPKELASLMVRVSQGELVSLRSRDRLLDIMRRTVNNSQLPQGLGEGATIAHKTGDIGILIGDVGLVDMPSGKRYATAVLIKRAFNDDRAYDLVQKISRVMYQHFVNATTPQNRSATPTPTTPLTPKLEPEETNTDAQYIPDDAPNTPERSIEPPDSVQASTPY